jgi:alpha/beta superfamily hydrolase
MAERFVQIDVPTGYIRRIHAIELLQKSNLAVIACHPWSLLGGSMHDIVVTQVAPRCAFLARALLLTRAC